MLLLICVDIIVAGLLVLTFPLYGLAGLPSIVFIFLFSVLVYAIVRELKKGAATYFLINLLMLPLILYFVIFLSVVIRLRLKYDFENFSVGVTRYQLFIDKIYKTYSISEVMDNENTHFKALMQGDFIRKNDTITLLNSNGIKVIKDTLSGFAKSGKVVILK